MVRELTVRAIVIGLVLSVVMAAANVYLGLKAGMTVSASIPAAVVGMLVLRGLFRDGTILEANQVQTTASAGESLAAGIIFTMPALILIGAWEEFDFVTTTVIAFTGGLLGILFMIPMRRVFVIDNEELRYPEGVACAAVLEAGDAEHEHAAADAKSVIVGGSIGAALKFLTSYFGVILGTLEGAVIAGGRVLFIGADISPALIGVGFIVRLNVAVLVFIGGAIGWLVCMPLLPEINAMLVAVGDAIGVAGLGTLPELPDEPVDRAWEIWSTRIRYIGVGAMVVGGISSIITVRHGLVRAVVELRKRRKNGDEEAAIPDTDRDLRPSAIMGFSLLAIFSIAAIYYHFTGGIGITVLTTVVMIVMSFFFVAVASYIVGLVGNSNSPVSGMTITAVLFTGAMLFIFGFSGEQGMLATLGVAAIVCCAACTSGDVCNDLKTGNMVGAAPFRQQTMQIAGVAIAALVMAPVLQLLHESYGIGSRELSAPQAGLFASLAEGFFGDGELPWGMVGVGVVIGIIIDATDKWLAHRGSSFRTHIMPVAVGMYLPFGLAIPILAGGVLAHFHGGGEKNTEKLDERLHRGVLFSSGIIAGESLIGVVIALLIWLELGIELPSFSFITVVTLVVALVVVSLFWRATKPASGR